MAISLRPFSRFWPYGRFRLAHGSRPRWFGCSTFGALLTSWWHSIKACSAFASTQGGSVLRTSFPRLWCRRSSLRTASCSRCCYESNEVRRQAEPLMNKSTLSMVPSIPESALRRPLHATHERPTQEPNQTESRLTDEIHDPFSHCNATGSVHSAITVRGRLRRAQRGYT